ncbi:winged helix DNA-binding domain-containing protein, partial [Acaromyces ingoldii]
MIHPSLAGLPGAGGSAGGSKQQPSFVSKLYSMLEDDSIEDMIAWGPSGTVFSVANPAEFSRIVLPNWFKHSNWQSFVRQLNMYGFHKVNHTYQGTPDDEIQVWEFKHPSFRRGEIHLLNDIKRK